MYLFKNRKNGIAKFELAGNDNLTATSMGRQRILFESSAVEEKPIFMWLGLGFLALLLHIWLIVNLLRPSEPVAPAKPLIMQVSMIPAPEPSVAAPETQAIKQLPPPPKKITKTKITKKTPAATSKPRIIRKPKLIPAPLTESEPESGKNDSPILMAPKPAAPTEKTPALDTEKFTEANYRANYGFNPKPKYPRIARKRNWQGKVLLRVQVSAEGASENITVHRSSGYETLDAAAVEAVEKWKFIPAKRGDKPVPSSVIVPIQFTLHD